MPSDIRSFFGGKPPPLSVSPTPPEKAPAKKGRGSRKVVDDSDDEEPAPKPKKASPTKPAKRAKTPEEEATTSSDYFGNSKPKRSEPVRAQPSKPTNGSTPVKETKSNGTSHATPKKASTPAKTKSAPGSTRSTRTKPKQSYVEDLDVDDFPDDLEEDDLAEMAKPKATPKATASTNGRGTAKSTPAKGTPASARSKRSQAKDVDYQEDEDVVMVDDDVDEDDFIVPDDDEDVAPKKTTKKAASTNKRKAKDIEEDEDDDLASPTKKRKATTTAPKSKKKEVVEDSSEIKDIMSSIPTIRAPTPPPRDEDGNLKFDFRAGPKNSGAPPAQGSKELPQGAENCLAGLTFVFTGLLETIQRDDAVNLVKQYGGKVTGAPSKKTSFVVLGSDAGPSKLKKIRENGLKTIDEDGLFELIRRLPANGGDSKAAAQQAEKAAKEEADLQKKVAEMEAEEKKAAAAAAAKKSSSAAAANAKDKGTVPDTRLWTVKYAPTQMSQICGNKAQVEKLQRWLRAFPKNQATNFKMPGPDGSGTFRAVIIHGPPGIGKTTAAHLVAKSEGYDIVESNASDTRSKKLVETGLKGVLDTRSLLGYFAGDGKEVEGSKKKLCLVMDEVDGMSAGDRGGVGAMAAVCKKANIPIILICNERKLPKMKPFDYVTYDLPFRRPTTDQIRGRIMTILFREGMKLPPNVVNALIEGTHADIRQIVNMVSTAKLDDAALDYEGGKSMSKAWEKHIILKPWDITGKILGGGMFSQASKATLNDKVELYFNDHEFSYLMLQENYLGTKPILAQNAPNDKLQKLKTLQLASKAADSISDGDLVDRMIHGSQQQWSLMPTHAVFSFVRPASYMAGSLAYGKTGFTSWLGQNSAQGKLTRFVKEIQGHMRLRTTGDRHEIRQQYLPVLWQELVNRLQTEGKEAIDEVIQLMDSYYLTRDDFDAIMELGVGPQKADKVKIGTQDKSAFTREYNKRDHPLPFMKASSVTAPKKLAKEKPDLEEAIEESDEEEVVEIKAEDDEDVDLSKDKYVKQPKKKRAAPAKGKGKKGNADDDEEGEEEKPKGKGKAAAKGKAKK